MIREKAILFKLNQIKISDKQLLESTRTSFETCPKCGAKECLSKHAPYKRDFISLSNGLRTDDKITIKRVRCSSCKTTHALLPDILIPFGSYSLRFVLHVLRAYLYRNRTVTALCAHFCIAHATLYKWIHLFNEQANLLLLSTQQLAWITIPALDFIEDITSLPSFFFKRYRFSFLQNTKRQILYSDPG